MDKQAIEFATQILFRVWQITDFLNLEWRTRFAQGWRIYILGDPKGILSWGCNLVYKFLPFYKCITSIACLSVSNTDP